jgi:hypothetical protein
MHVLCTSIVIDGFPLSSNARWLPALLKCAIQQACYGRLAVVSDVSDGGFALNVDKELRGSAVL